MIVRILGAGQYQLDEAAFAAVHEIDDRVQAAADSGDGDGFGAALAELVATVRRMGTPLPPEDLHPSDAIVPEAGTTLEEARELLSSEGLIPS